MVMKVYDNISLKSYNTFGIDVKAKHLIVVEGVGDLPLLKERTVGRVLFLGAGSDIVFTRDFDGTVVCQQGGRVRYEKTESGTRVVAPAGLMLDDLVRRTLDRGLYGLENLSAIPGTVGAAAVQNVGAYGVEAKDYISEVTLFHLDTGHLTTLDNKACKFGYRTSCFKGGDGFQMIVSVTFLLPDTPVYEPNLSYKALADEVGRRCGKRRPSAHEVRRIITDLRWSKLPRPEENGSAGSFFKNPVVTADVYECLKTEYPDMPEGHPCFNGQSSTPTYKLSAGWLIDRAGWKGRTLGRAGVWHSNALVLYNAGGCSGDEVCALAAAIQQDVKRKFNVVLEPEAIII